MAKKKISMINVPESDLLNYITLDEFANQYGKKPATIRKRADEIPGLVYTKDGYLVLRGTRYPCNIANYRIDSNAKRRYLLLKAIDANKYISCTELSMDEEEFEQLLLQSVKFGLIEKRNLPNQAGANGYICTPDGENFLLTHAPSYDKKKWEKFETYAPLLLGLVGDLFPLIQALFTTG